MEGWISIHRTLQSHWLWEGEPFSKGQAWVDILLMVNFTDRMVMLGTELVEVKRGSRITSIRKLCDRWGWSNTKVKAFLKALEKDNMIVVKSDTKKTTLTVVKYNDYQVQNTKENDTETSQKHHRNDGETTQKHTNNNVNNVNNENKDIYSDFVSEIVLKKYPGTKTKGPRDKKLPRILNKYGVEEMERCIDRYVLDVKGKDKRYILTEGTFWNGRYIDYLDENYVVEDNPIPLTTYRAKGSDEIVW